MADALELIKAVKRVSVDAVNSAKPVEVCFGKVMGASPLKIFVEQKLILGEAQLVLCRNVCDFFTVIDGKYVEVQNGLKAGETVVLLRQQGGQKYLVMDRVGDA